MRLGLDIDGVLSDFTGTVSRLVWDVFHQVADETRYDLGLGLNQYKDIIDLKIDGGLYLAQDAYEGTAHTVQQWAKTHEIFYITRRRPGNACDKRMYHLKAQTYLWLRRHDFPSWHNVIFTQDKAATCHEHDIPVLVEDYLGDCLKHYGLMKSGGNFYAVLIDRPWNQGEFPRRVKHLQEAAEHFPH